MLIYEFSSKTSTNFSLGDETYEQDTVFKDNYAADLTYTTTTDDSLYDQSVDLPAYNHSLYLKTRTPSAETGVKQELATWSGFHEHYDPPNFYTKCYLDGIYRLPKKFARYLGRPGILTLKIQFLCDFPQGMGTFNHWELDVSKWLKNAAVTYIAAKASGTSWVMRAVAAGSFVWDSSVPEFKVRAWFDGVLVNRLFSGMSISVAGYYSAAYFDADFREPEFEVTESLSSWHLLSGSETSLDSESHNE